MGVLKDEEEVARWTERRTAFQAEGPAHDEVSGTFVKREKAGQRQKQVRERTAERGSQKHS